MTLLQKARVGRIDALETLASFNIDNIFAEDADDSRPRSRPAAQALTFASARAPANTPATPELLCAA